MSLRNAFSFASPRSDIAQRKLWLAAYILISAIWWIVATTVAARWTVLGTDSIMYALPLGVERHPFDLGIPFLGDFESYSHYWGHQWPGALWVRGVIFMVLPFSHASDFAVIAFFQWVAATVCGAMVWRWTRQAWLGLSCALLILSDRIFLDGANHRAETLAAACLALLCYDLSLAREAQGRWGRWSAALADFLIPSVHPYAMVLGGLLIAGEAAEGWRTDGRIQRRSWVRLALFASGGAALVAWYALQPRALEQLRANIELQKTFSQHWNTVWLGLGNYRLGSGYALWAAAVGAMIFLWTAATPETTARRGREAWRWIFPCWFLTIPFLQTVTRCENFNYLSLACPPAAVLITSAVSALDEQGRLGPRRALMGARVALLALVGLFGLVLPYRALLWWRNGHPDLRSELTAVLAEIPAGATVFIPPSFWDAALMDRRHQFRQWTFSVASTVERRRRYETQAYGMARAGDFLIVDRQLAAGYDRFGVLPTLPLLPPDAQIWSPRFEHVHLFEGAIRWGHDYAIYEHR